MNAPIRFLVAFAVAIISGVVVSLLLRLILPDMSPDLRTICLVMILVPINGLIMSRYVFPREDRQ